MPKFLGNRVGYAASTSSDGGIFSLSSQQIFLRLLEKWPPSLTVSTSVPSTSVAATRQRYIVFNSPGTFTIGGSGYLHYTIVGGGGGGGTGESDYGFTGAGGGGAGGFRSGTVFIGPGTYTATVGSGGNGGAYPPSSSDATNGSPSLLSGPSNFTAIESAGGGYGGSYIPLRNGGNGGSAGGGSAPYNDDRCRNPGNGNTPSFTPPQGNPGGTASAYGGGGGGGAGGPGKSGMSNRDLPGERMKGGDGGEGRAWGVIAEDLLSGLTLGYQGKNILAGGGGGGGGFDSDFVGNNPHHPNAGIGTHGAGPGGSGLKYIPGTSPSQYGENGYDAQSNTGSGGGGGSAGNRSFSSDNNDGGDGGSGIIIISHTY